ncbi:MAG TPA: GMC family oxidoreductase [Bryobacteraceae bacterium]|nr:GMC family oxidoreductase [Bryobacteraceae bacterium]
MPRLSSPVREIKNHYTLVVIGSGYGGAIAASRLARAGQQVCILEKGREFQPGDYPDTEAEALAEVQAELPGGQVGSRAGLYQFHINPDVNVFAGCGLGGTSLINSNIALRPEPRVFEDPRWPRALRDDPDSLEEGYRRAEEMLRPIGYPERYPALPKLEALGQSAARLNQECTRAPMAVNFTEGINHVGVLQHPCILCGDCITGCNYSAKNTVLFNYLPDARNFGAEIYTGVCVRYLERKDGRWLAHYQVLETGLEDYDEPLATVSADIVVLAAGTLGSTEIMLRSKAKGLALSDQVGHRFSGNGDVLGFSYGCAEEIRGVGYGHRDPRDMEAVGPTVTGMIDMRRQPDLDAGVVIHEMAAPGALSGLLPVALAQTASALGRNTAELAMATEESEIESLFTGPYDNLANDTQAYLVTTHEQRAGNMRLENDRLRIEWPHVGDQAIFRKVNETLAEATRALGGKYLINPVWSTVFNRDLITLHPLGGCVMADDAADGVVNHKGQAFLTSRGTAVHEGLYICDGSTVPRSLGAGPLLTISALGERTCAMLAADRGWTIDYTLAARTPPAPRRTTAPGIQFTETLRGDALALDLSVVSDDLDELMRNSSGVARVAGHVSAAALSSGKLKAAGEFRLNPMAYQLKLISREGKTYSLEGTRDARSVQVNVHEGDSKHGPPLIAETLRLLPQDLRRQLTTLRVWNATGTRERLEATARFGRALAGDLYDVYGGVAEGRKKRPLRVNAPTVYKLSGPQPLLVRYEGGSRGPLLLSGGPRISSQIFLIDTIETNLVEFLFAHSYDIWLVDTTDSQERAAAVAKVKEITGAAGVQELADGMDTAGNVPLNAATRESAPKAWHGIAIIGTNAAREVYPRVLDKLRASEVSVLR